MPLGIRAVVAAIYEPPQISSPLEVELMDDQGEEEAVNMVAKHLGLQKVDSLVCNVNVIIAPFHPLSFDLPQVGWIFTDLEPRKSGKVAYKRHIVSSPSTLGG